MGAFFKYLRDSSGSIQMTEDYSSQSEVFKHTMESGGYISRAIIRIQDSGNFSVDSYGVLTELTNGLLVRVYDENDVVQQDLLDSKPIVNNGDWAALCFDASLSNFDAGSVGVLAVRWTFEKSGAPLRIRKNWYFGVTCQDNLTGLLEHTVNIQGVYN